MIAPAAHLVSHAPHAAASVQAKTIPATSFSGLLEEVGAPEAPTPKTPAVAQDGKAAEAGRKPALPPDRSVSGAPAATDDDGGLPQADQPANSFVPVIDGRNARGRSTSQLADAKTSLKPATATQAFPITVPVVPAPPALLPLSLTKALSGLGGEAPERGSKSPAAPQSSAEPVALDPAAIEIRIRAKEDAPVPKAASAPTAPQPASQIPPQQSAAAHTPVSATKSDTSNSDEQTAQAQPTPVRSAEPAHSSAPAITELAVDHAGSPVATTTAPLTAPHAPVSALVAHAPEPAPAKSPEPPARSSLIEEPVERPSAANQPVRSLSLEFTPDGAGDVRLRLSERTGEVHISLHASDSALGSRLHEGMHDLVGSLSSAGYDAEAWTPGQEQQQNRRDPDEQQNHRAASSDSGEANFADLFQQPVQEVS